MQTIDFAVALAPPPLDGQALAARIKANDIKGMTPRELYAGLGTLRQAQASPRCITVHTPDQMRAAVRALGLITGYATVCYTFAYRLAVVYRMAGKQFASTPQPNPVQGSVVDRHIFAKTKDDEVVFRFGTRSANFYIKGTPAEVAKVLTNEQGKVVVRVHEP